MNTARQPSQSKVNLFGLDREGLRAQFAAWDEKPFRAEQVMQWIYGRGVADFAAMTTLSKALRVKLAELAEVRTPELVTEQTSADGTRKWVLRLDGGQAVETVFIPQEDRGTLCISSQVGCAMDCSFCSTGKQGFSRNMNAAEIVAQVWFASRALGAGPGPAQRVISGSHSFSPRGREDKDAGAARRVISNVVFMGMGEPLANFDALVPAIRILLDDFGFGLSKRRVTVSTSGLVPFMDRLHETVDVALAVSLHAPTDALRDELVPINRKYPLKDLMSACNRYVQGKNGHAHIMYEYVMLDGVNDHEEHARQLATLLRGRPAKVNLIPFNPFPNTEYRRSKPERVRRFQEILMTRHILTTVRRTRGDDIDAACGQLVGKVQSRQKNRLRGVPIEVHA
ncbi:MAG: 23S rRNA (adenine(2503)-C(2))-methyltransferase RlmN [Nevskiales bacterium]